MLKNFFASIGLLAVALDVNLYFGFVEGVAPWVKYFGGIVLLAIIIFSNRNKELRLGSVKVVE